jgi:hypothetical protein
MGEWTPIKPGSTMLLWSWVPLSPLVTGLDAVQNGGLVEARAEGEGEMRILRLAVPAVVAAAALAGCFTYFVTPPPRVEAEAQPAPTARGVLAAAPVTPAHVGQDRSAEDFLRAAEAILRPLSNAQAASRIDELPIIGHVPLPKRRPIPR